MLDTMALIRNTVIEKRKDLFWMAPFVILVLWTLDTIVSFFITGFTGWTWAFTAGLLLRAVIVASNLYFLKKVFLLNTKSSYMHLKTYSGYFIVFVYVFYNLPRMSLVTDGLISGEREIILWISSFISSLLPFVLYIVLWLKKTREAWGVYKDKKTLKEERQRHRHKRTWKEKLWENTDAVISSIITVIIIQHFIFQLYVIPTESMVPTFLVGDRTFVTKFMSGPGIPLTDWKLPRLREPKKGDIVVFQSPEYTQSSLAKRVFQQFVRYITLTLVDIDRDEEGHIRKRFIVKRLTGVPGEKYMMIDDVLYVKRKGDKDFAVDEQDKKYANYNLYNLPESIKRNIQIFPITESQREFLDYWDNLKNTADVKELETELRQNHSTLVKEAGTLGFIQRSFFFESFRRSLPAGQSPSTLITEKYESLQALGIRPFQQFNSWYNDIYFFYEFLNGNTAEVDSTVRDALISTADLDPYEESARKLNLMIKNIQLKRFLIYVKLASEMIPYENWGMAEELKKNISAQTDLVLYLVDNFDRRNFPEFPAGKDEYIPKNHYFLIGDNRYNSLDFRFDHSGYSLRHLDGTDPGSIAYPSQLKPYLLTKKNILGIARATFWPFSRAKWHTR